MPASTEVNGVKEEPKVEGVKMGSNEGAES